MSFFTSKRNQEKHTVQIQILSVLYRCNFWRKLVTVVAPKEIPPPVLKKGNFNPKNHLHFPVSFNPRAL